MIINIPDKRISQPVDNKAHVSFKGANTIITAARDKNIIGVFTKHYGNIGENIGETLYNLKSSEFKIVRESSRFSTSGNGVLSIKDKNIGRSLIENILFPVISLPLHAANFLLKKAQNVPFLQNAAKNLYNRPLLRVHRELGELDTKTDILKGILDKTEKTITDFSKEKGITPEKLLELLNKPEKDLTQNEIALVKEANNYIRESLYKLSNKFFDKNTGNLNLAHERPANRIITGLLPAPFLANDAYNLSVLCGDSKEESEKEANKRMKQEILRIGITAYLQLLVFGAFTKQVNNSAWFAPVLSAGIVFFSEIYARYKLGNPVFFLSSEEALKYNKEQNQDENSRTKDSEEEKQIQSQQSVSEPETDKKEKRKALMNFDTFKKGVLVLTGTFFTLSFLKNSSYTKNSAIVQGFNNLGKYIKKKIYEPLAYKDFEISTEQYKNVMKSLEDVGGKELKEGHEFIQSKYAREENGVIKIFKSSLSDDGIENVSHSVLKQMKFINMTFNKDEANIIKNAIKTAVRLKNSNIAEKKYDQTAKQAIDIIKKKNITLNAEQEKEIQSIIIKEIKNNAKETPLKVATKLKPFVDIVTEPFKFVFSAARLPFKLTKAGINLIFGKIEKKAAKAELGEENLKNWELKIHRILTEIFGEKQGKSDKINQVVFVNAMEQLEKKTLPYRKAEKALNDAIKEKKNDEEIKKLREITDKAKKELTEYVNTSVEKSFNSVTQSSNKNTDLALMTKLASSTVTSAFLVADNYNMVMIKSKGKNKEEAKEKANERIIQRGSGLFSQAMFINWFNQTFKSTYNSSLLGMAKVAVPNTLTTEYFMRASIGMPIRRKTLNEINEMDRENENRKGFAGKYFEFMRLLTGKKPLKDRLPKEKQNNNENFDVKIVKNNQNHSKRKMYVVKPKNNVNSVC